MSLDVGEATQSRPSATPSSKPSDALAWVIALMPLYLTLVGVIALQLFGLSLHVSGLVCLIFFVVINGALSWADSHAVSHAGGSTLGPVVGALLPPVYLAVRRPAHANAGMFMAWIIAALSWIVIPVGYEASTQDVANSMASQYQSSHKANAIASCPESGTLSFVKGKTFKCTLTDQSTQKSAEVPVLNSEDGSMTWSEPQLGSPVVSTTSTPGTYQGSRVCLLRAFIAGLEPVLPITASVVSPCLLK